MVPWSEIMSNIKVHTPNRKMGFLNSLTSAFTGATRKVGNTNAYKSAERKFNSFQKGSVTHGKTVKRFFTGEGEMMKLYSTARNYFDAGDVQGLESYLPYVQNYQPGFGSAKQEKKALLVEYISFLISKLKGKTNILNAKKESVLALADPSHEIGRRVRGHLAGLNLPNLANNNSVNANGYNINTFRDPVTGQVNINAYERMRVGGGRRKTRKAKKTRRGHRK